MSCETPFRPGFGSLAIARNFLSFFFFFVRTSFLLQPESSLYFLLAESRFSLTVDVLFDPQKHFHFVTARCSGGQVGNLRCTQTQRKRARAHENFNQAIFTKTFSEAQSSLCFCRIGHLNLNYQVASRPGPTQSRLRRPPLPRCRLGDNIRENLTRLHRQSYTGASKSSAFTFDGCLHLHKVGSLNCYRHFIHSTSHYLELSQPDGRHTPHFDLLSVSSQLLRQTPSRKSDFSLRDCHAPKMDAQYVLPTSPSSRRLPWLGLYGPRPTRHKRC